MGNTLEREGFYTELTTNLTPRAQITATPGAGKAQGTRPGPAPTLVGDLWDATGHKIKVSTEESTLEGGTG